MIDIKSELNMASSYEHQGIPKKLIWCCPSVTWSNAIIGKDLAMNWSWDLYVLYFLRKWLSLFKMTCFQLINCNLCQHCQGYCKTANVNLEWHHITSWPWLFYFHMALFSVWIVHIWQHKCKTLKLLTKTDLMSCWLTQRF